MNQDSSWSTIACSRCGQRFECGAGTPQRACWCTELPPLSLADIAQLAVGPGCLCRQCLSALSSASPPG